MKRALLLYALLTAGLVSCDKIPSGTVEPVYNVSGLVSFTAPSEKNQADQDSSFQVSLSLYSNEEPQEVYISLDSQDGRISLGKFSMQAEGEFSPVKERKYSCRPFISSKQAAGLYSVNAYLLKKNGTEIKIASGSLLYSSSVYIRDSFYFVSVNMPDSVKFGTSCSFSVTAGSRLGASYLPGISYMVYYPDGTLLHNSQGISVFPLPFSGSGPNAALENIYGYSLQFPNKPGYWTFRFYLGTDASGSYKEHKIKLY